MTLAQVAFKTPRDRIKAFKILPKGVAIIGRPVRELVLTVEQLKKIKEEGIKVYPPSINGKTQFKKELDVDEVIKRCSK